MKSLPGLATIIGTCFLLGCSAPEKVDGARDAFLTSDKVTIKYNSGNSKKRQYDLYVNDSVVGNVTGNIIFSTDEKMKLTFNDTTSDSTNLFHGWQNKEYFTPRTNRWKYNKSDNSFILHGSNGEVDYKLKSNGTFLKTYDVIRVDDKVDVSPSNAVIDATRLISKGFKK